MRPVILLPLLLVTAACAAQKVDPALVGTWELDVPNAEGVARWVWEIDRNGTYAFHAEGPGDVPSHSGVFQASRGRYLLRSTTLAWADTGSYRPIAPDTISFTGRLGTASWTRVRQVVAEIPRDSSRARDNEPLRPGSVSASGIYDYLSHHPFDDRFFTAPLTLTRSVTVAPDPEQQGDGAVGIVQAEVGGSISPATISLVVYRDRAAAERAFRLNALADSDGFRMKPGQFVSTHVYTYRERGEAYCLSRMMIGESTRATVTCYLLVIYPTAEPVIVESSLSEDVPAGGQEASLDAVGKADDLIFIGLKQWAEASSAIAGQDR